jgi:uncharacterized protein (TIGR00251 family)
MSRSDPAMSADDLDLVEVEGGVRLRLRVKAGARQDAILGTHAGAIKLSVTAAPEKGKANKAVLALLAGRFDVPASSIELVSGMRAPDKTVFVPIDAAALRRRFSRT